MSLTRPRLSSKNGKGKTSPTASGHEYRVIGVYTSNRRTLYSTLPLFPHSSRSFSPGLVVGFFGSFSPVFLFFLFLTRLDNEPSTANE